MTIKPYIIFSLIAAFFFSLSTLTNKFASKHKIANPWVMLFYSTLTFVPFLLLVPLFFNVSFPIAGWSYIFLYSLTFFIGHIFFILAIYRLDASTFAPFFQLQSVFVVILAFLFLGERFPSSNYLFIILILLGSILVSLDEKMNLKTYFKLGILLIISQQLFHAFSNLFAGFALRSINSFTLIFWGDLTTAALALLIIPFIGFSKLKVSASQIKPLLLAGFFSIAGATLLFTAFQTNVTISSVLSLLTSPIVLVFTIIASVVRPRLLEHHTKKVYAIRTLGVLLILIGAIKLSTG